MKPKTISPFFKKPLFGYSLVILACAVLYVVASGWTIPSERAIAPVSDPSSPECYHQVVFDPEMIEALKQKTLVFVIRDQDKPNKEEFEKMLEAWTFTKNKKLIDYDELADHSGPEYIQCTLQCFIEHTQNGQIRHNYLSFRYSYEENGKTKTIYLARWDFDNDEGFLWEVGRVRMAQSPGIFYKNEGTIGSWTPGFLSLYLKETQRKLNEGLRSPYEEQFREEQDMELLKKDTLYIPEQFLKRYKVTGKESKEPYAPEVLFAKYPYTCIVISRDVLSEMILNKEAKYVMDFLYVPGGSFIRVFDRDKGKIFQTYQYAKIRLNPEQVGLIFPKD